MNIALLTLARAGSRRIPNKNKRNFLGKPLIEWTLSDMEKISNVIKISDMICVSDDVEIADICKKYKDVEWYDYPKRLAGDKHNIKESCKYAASRIDYAFDYMVLLQPTSPIRDINIVINAVENMALNNYDCGVSVYPIKNKYAYMSCKPLNFDMIKRDGNPIKREEVLIENGSFYIFKKDMLKNKYILNNNVALYRDEFNLDLDTLKDWEDAEWEFRKEQRQV